MAVHLVKLSHLIKPFNAMIDCSNEIISGKAAKSANRSIELIRIVYGGESLLGFSLDIFVQPVRYGCFTLLQILYGRSSLNDRLFFCPNVTPDPHTTLGKCQIETARMEHNSVQPKLDQIAERFSSLNSPNSGIKLEAPLHAFEFL